MNDERLQPGKLLASWKLGVCRKQALFETCPVAELRDRDPLPRRADGRALALLAGIGSGWVPGAHFVTEHFHAPEEASRRGT